MTRDRSTKALAKRIQLDYFLKPHPLRTAMRLAVVLAPCFAALWLAWALGTGNDEIFTSGPVSTRHAMFGRDCTQCHVAWQGTPDARCLQCHDAPIHHEEQTRTPPCASCHLEHRGQTVLARMTDAHCTACHANLVTRAGAPGYEAHIRSVTDGHPEFTVLKTKARDTAALKLNHKVHLKPHLAGPNGPTTLACVDCHHPAPAGHRMAAVTFERDCKSCHPLALGLTLPGAVAPHEDPRRVDASVREQLARAVALHPELARPAEDEGPGRRRRRGEESAPKTPLSTADWLASQAREIESVLFGKTCKLCHEMKPAEAGLPGVVPTAVPAVWLKHARFDHRSHRPLRCVLCHATAPTSTETADVNLPPMATCTICHSPAGGAGWTCVECHGYHDKTRERTWDGPMSFGPAGLALRGRGAKTD